MFIGFCNISMIGKNLEWNNFNLFLLLAWFVGTFFLLSLCDLSNENTFSQTYFSFFVLVHFSISFAKTPSDFHWSLTIIMVSLHFIGKGFTLSKNCCKFWTASFWYPLHHVLPMCWPLCMVCVFTHVEKVSRVLGKWKPFLSVSMSCFCFRKLTAVFTEKSRYLRGTVLHSCASFLLFLFNLLESAYKDGEFWELRKLFLSCF